MGLVPCGDSPVALRLRWRKPIERFHPPQGHLGPRQESMAGRHKEGGTFHPRIRAPRCNQTQVRVGIPEQIE